MDDVVHTLNRIDGLLTAVAEQAAESDALGRLSDVAAKALRDSGVIRGLQPREFGGAESHPVEFLENVMAVSAHSGSAGWVYGVVGLHPWEIAQADHRVQTEIWGADPDTWVASPYAPIGRARPVEGGYLLSGEWPFSSGTEHCEWIVLGGIVTDEHGAVGRPPDVRHFILPRADYEILAGTWDVMGLKGTGSKDIRITDAFVPGYRVIEPSGLEDGSTARAAGRDNPLYSLPFGMIFPGAIAAGTVGMAEGALAAYVAYTRERLTGWSKAKAIDNPFQLAAFGEAASDVEASRNQILGDIGRMYDTAAAGRPIPFEPRVVARRNQTRAVRRAVEAVDKLFMIAGANSIRSTNPLQRFWRDLHAGSNHMCNVAEPNYQAFALHTFGQPIPPTIRI